MPHVFIATPTTKRLVGSLYCASMVMCATRLTRRGIEVSYACTEGYDIVQQRDLLATMFLQSQATHLLFIDDDMGIPPELPEKLLSFKKPIVAAVCPQRAIDAQRLEVLIKGGLSGQQALSLALNYSIIGPKFPLVGELLEAEANGAAVMMIARECFERLITETDVREYKIHPNRTVVKSFFHREVAADGEHVPEDWSFCMRWRRIGGQIWTYPFAHIQHTGPHVFGGSYAAVVKTAPTTQVDRRPPAMDK